MAEQVSSDIAPVHSQDSNIEGDPSLADHHLMADALGLVQSAIFSIGGAAPTISTSLTLAALAVAANRGSAPSVVVVALPMLAIAWSFNRLNRWDPNCGFAYVWVGRIVNSYVGFVIGWIVIVGNALAVVAEALPVGPSALALLGLNPSNQFGAAVATVLLVGVMISLAILGIRLTGRAQVTIAVVEFTIVICFVVIGLVKTFITHPKGFVHPTAGWLSPLGVGGRGSFVAAMLVAVFMIAGWEAPVYVNEETHKPRTTPGRAMVVGIVAIAIALAIMATAFQGVAPLDQLNANAGSGLSYVGGRLAGSAGDKLLSVAVLLSAVATIQITTISAARIMYAMGVDRLLPRRFGRTHPKHLTPVLATALCGYGAIVIAIVAIYSSSVASAFDTLINTDGVLFAIFYAAIALTGCWFYRRHWRESATQKAFLVVSLVAAGFLLWIFVKSVIAFSPGTKWAGVGVVGAGVILMLWARFRYRAPYFNIARETAAGLETKQH
jgi:amino acid transporter